MTIHTTKTTTSITHLLSLSLLLLLWILHVLLMPLLQWLWLHSFSSIFSSSSSLQVWLFTLMIATLYVYLVMEILFYVVYHFYFLPHANISNSNLSTSSQQQQQQQHIVYLDYPLPYTRHCLLLRVIQRLEQTARATHQPIKQVVQEFLLPWFQQTDNDNDIVEEETRAPAIATATNRRLTSSSSSSSSSVPMLCKQDTDTSSSSSSSGSSGISSFNSSSSESDSDEAEQQEEEEENESDYSHNDDDDVDNQDNVKNKNDYWTINGLGYEQIGEFFSWSLFNRTVHEIMNNIELREERIELEKCIDITRQKLGLVFPKQQQKQGQQSKKGKHTHNNDKSSRLLRPRCMSFENVNTLHRPLIVYLIVIMIHFVATRCILQGMMSFQRVVTRTGLVAWVYIPPKQQQQQQSQNNQLQPLFFFHGIAPAGITFYLPMVLYLTDLLSWSSWPLSLFVNRKQHQRQQRPLVLFEFKPISCAIGFQALTEQETVAGIQEIVQTYFTTSSLQEQQQQPQRLAICGHSFGSCPITWILRSPLLRQRLGQVILLDPVSILLSESNVMVNFLYNNNNNTQNNSKRMTRLVASSELFTQYYIRRKFAWYNSELWLSDIPPNVPVTISLSGQDEIVHAPNVKAHVEQFQQAQAAAAAQQQQQRQQRHYEHNHNTKLSPATTTTTSGGPAVVKLLYWEQARHADCIMCTRKQWQQFKKVLLEQELNQLHQQSVQVTTTTTTTTKKLQG